MDFCRENDNNTEGREEGRETSSISDFHCSLLPHLNKNRRELHCTPAAVSLSFPNDYGLQLYLEGAAQDSLG
jgi:hypothetical protein